ncbi:MAG: phosphatidate cytidylyltransferase [Bacteroidetes bacterium]|nr:phosphatidate cytidylyltransferase [Bacteroidota bacterium]MBS1669933.1 phosphatidate cytidylyltransferase [Bacteroidota bacterium]
MAFNIQTFKTRTLTAIIFAVVMLTGLLYNHWSFFILFSVIHFGCWIEYQKLIGIIDKNYLSITSFHRNCIMLIGWCFMLYMCGGMYKIGNFSLKGIGEYGILILIIIFCLFEIVFKKNLNVKLIAHSIFGLLYISLSWGLMIGLRSVTNLIEAKNFVTELGFVVPILLVASIWINDTMQYIVGSLIGKTPFSKISPKKTWEGTVGGSLLCVIVVSLVGYYALHISLQLCIGVSAIAAIMGTAGDLLESKLKRLANVKDSGNFMPGHGGFLDRFDSLLLATPFVWLFVFFFA